MIPQGLCSVLRVSLGGVQETICSVKIEPGWLPTRQTLYPICYPFSPIVGLNCGTGFRYYILTICESGGDCKKVRRREKWAI